MSAHGGVGDSGGQAAVGEDLWVDAADQLPQLGQGLLGLLVGGADLLCGGRVGRQVEPNLAKGHGQGDQPLLGAVVQVALDAAPLQLEGIGQAGPRAGDLDQPLVQLHLAGREDQPGEGGAGACPGGEQVGRRQQCPPRRRRASPLGCPIRAAAPGERDHAGGDGQGRGDHGQVDQPQRDRADDAVADLEGAVGPFGPPGRSGRGRPASACSRQCS